MVFDHGIGETSPALDTSDGSSSGAVLPVIRWVFPKEGRRTDLTSRPIVLGRDPDCGCHLPGEETSRRHATIRRANGQHILSDLQSRNGVFVNGERITESPLAPGDVLRLGEWVGVVALLPVAQLPHQFRESVEVAPGLLAGPVMQPILDVARRVAVASDIPVLLVGETGTGKERVAAAIHRWSGRAGRFVGINCAAIPSQLAEAELFGHRRGAFTGADKASEGYFRAADGGTLLLDELMELPLPLQAKLLRTLQEGEVLPLGETTPVRVDVRVIAAAQCALQQDVDAGRVRADLYARLNGITINLPPLRQRREEVPALFRYLAAQAGAPAGWKTSPRFVERLCIHDWPYNVRELERLVRQLVALHSGEQLLQRSHLPASIQQQPRRGAGTEPAVAPSAAAKAAAPAPEDLPAALIAALRANGGNVSKAAAVVGISRQRAYRMLEAAESVKLDALRGASRRNYENDGE